MPALILDLRKRIARAVKNGGVCAGGCGAAAGLSNSALSQHLAVLREQGVVDFRRASQTLWYRISDPRIELLFASLHDLFCGADDEPYASRAPDGVPDAGG